MNDDIGTAPIPPRQCSAHNGGVSGFNCVVAVCRQAVLDAHKVGKATLRRDCTHITSFVCWAGAVAGAVGIWVFSQLHRHS